MLLGDAWKSLYNLSLVHRSWKWPAQKALGRVILSRDNGYLFDRLLDQGTPLTIFGPWTTSIAIWIPKAVYQYSCRFEAVKTLLLRISKNLKHLMVFSRSTIPLE